MPQEIVGGTYADSRGVLRFCNDFDMSAVKRFYTIANSAACARVDWPQERDEVVLPVEGEDYYSG